MKNAYTFSTKDIVHHASVYEHPMLSNGYPVARLVQESRGISYVQAFDACRSERRTKEEMNARFRFVAALTGLSPDQMEHYKKDDSEPGISYTANTILDTFECYDAPGMEKHAIVGFLSSMLTMGIAKSMLEKSTNGDVKIKPES